MIKNLKLLNEGYNQPKIFTGAKGQYLMKETESI